MMSAGEFGGESDPDDGPGDTPDRPDIWATPTEGGGTIITPGDNQPVNEGTNASGNPTLDFDQPMSEDSEVVETGGDDSGSDDTGGDE